MTELSDLAWTAGLIDGDGCVSMTHTSAKSPFRKPYVCVDSTDTEIINEFVRLYGGSVVVKKVADVEKHRQAWSWRLTGAHQVRVFLAAISPFMRCETKRERARMLIEEYSEVTPRNGHYTPELRAKKLEFQDRFMALGSDRGIRRSVALRL